jgi:hypothetical protein
MRIGFSGAGTLYTYSIDRGVVARVPFDGDVAAPIFGPATDDYVTFGSQRGVWVAALDGSKPAEPLTAPQSKSLVPGSWSSDGTTLVLTELTGGNGDIAVLRRGDKQVTPLVATPADERLPELSPDDRWVAYASNESGRYEVYVRPFRGPGGRYTVSAGGGEMPMWSKDGRRLFYVRENTNLMAVDVNATAAFAASAPRLVTTSSDLTVRTVGPRGRNPRPFDVARDGRLLVVHSTESDSREQIAYVVLNFDEDIRRRLAPAKP